MMFEKIFKIIRPVDENVIGMSINRLLEASPLEAGPLNEIFQTDRKVSLNLQPSNHHQANRHQSQALRRKQHSEALLVDLGLSVDAHLPVIEDESQSITRGRPEIVERCIALLVVAAKGEGLEQEFIDQLMCQYDVSRMLTPMEEHFVTAMEPSEGEYIRFIWRYEAAWVMLWALNYVDTLELPLNLCDVEYAIRCLQSRTFNDFAEQAELRDLSALLDEADLAVRYHNAVAENGDATLLNAGVVQERYNALMWLIGHNGIDWDGLSFNS